MVMIIQDWTEAGRTTAPIPTTTSFRPRQQPPLRPITFTSERAVKLGSSSTESKQPKDFVRKAVETYQQARSPPLKRSYSHIATDDQAINSRRTQEPVVIANLETPSLLTRYWHAAYGLVTGFFHAIKPDLGGVQTVHESVVVQDGDKRRRVCMPGAFDPSDKDMTRAIVHVRRPSGASPRSKTNSPPNRELACIENKYSQDGKRDGTTVSKPSSDVDSDNETIYSTDDEYEYVEPIPTHLPAKDRKVRAYTRPSKKRKAPSPDIVEASSSLATAKGNGNVALELFPHSANYVRARRIQKKKKSQNEENISAPPPSEASSRTMLGSLHARLSKITKSTWNHVAHFSHTSPKRQARKHVPTKRLHVMPFPQFSTSSRVPSHASKHGSREASPESKTIRKAQNYRRYVEGPGLRAALRDAEDAHEAKLAMKYRGRAEKPTGIAHVTPDRARPSPVLKRHAAEQLPTMDMSELPDAPPPRRVHFEESVFPLPKPIAHAKLFSSWKKPGELASPYGRETFHVIQSRAFRSPASTVLSTPGGQQQTPNRGMPYYEDELGNDNVEETPSEVRHLFHQFNNLKVSRQAREFRDEADEYSAWIIGKRDHLAKEKREQKEKERKEEERRKHKKEQEEKEKKEKAKAKDEEEQEKKKQKQLEKDGKAGKSLALDSLVQQLSDEAVSKLETAMKIDDPLAVLTPDTVKTPLKRKDFGTVNPQTAADGIGWLNDEVVNSYLEAAVARTLEKNEHEAGTTPQHHAFSTFLYNTFKDKGYDGVKRWAKRAKIDGKKLLQVKSVLIPINYSSHWTLIAVSGTDKTIKFYNSMSGSGKQYLDFARDYVRGVLGPDDYVEADWKVTKEASVQQQNGLDCGVFVCMNGLAVLAGREPVEAFRADEMQLARQQIAATLLTGGFTGEFDFLH